MSDVWKGLVERLKQKAKFAQDICHAISEAWRSWELREKLEMEEWVRLEDVLNTLQEIRENYVLIPKKKLMEKLAEIKLYGTKINGQLSDNANTGSSTGWLMTQWSVEPNEEFNLIFHIHDTSDGILDSEVILDAFQFLGEADPGTVIVE